LSLTGFESREIDDILFRREDSSTPEEDETPELLEVTVSRPGDVWICGEDARRQHRVACGDATVAEDVTHLLGPARPALMTTDPPYGVQYDPRWREQAGLGRPRQTGKVVNDDRIDWSAAYQLFPGDTAYVWHAGFAAMAREHRGERLPKIHPRPPLVSKLVVAIERGATMASSISAIRQRFYPVVNQAVFGRVDLRLHISNASLNPE
jgi:hypothetical protein